MNYKNTPFSSRCILPPDWPKIRYFTPREFRHPAFMGFEFVQWLDELRNKLGFPIVITSDHRTVKYNAEIGGAPDSAHCDVPCNAVDIGERPRADDPNWNRSRFRIVETALEMGCSRIGMYANGSLHLDLCHDKRPSERLWRVVGKVPSHF